MTDGHDSRMPVTRRQVIAASSIVTVGAAGAFGTGDEGGILRGGTMALDQDYKLAESDRTLYQGPDSAKSGISGQVGDRYEAVDTGLSYHWDPDVGGWSDPHTIGSSSNPVPSVTTEDVDTERLGSDRHYAGSYDGADADARFSNALAAASGGDTIYLENAEYVSHTINKGVTIIGTAQYSGFGSGSRIGPSEKWTVDGESSSTGVRIQNVNADTPNPGITNIEVNTRAVLVGGYLRAECAIQVNEDRFIMAQCAFGDVTFASGTTEGIVDSCVGTTVTDNGTNTVGDIG